MTDEGCEMCDARIVKVGGGDWQHVATGSRFCSVVDTDTRFATPRLHDGLQVWTYPDGDKQLVSAFCNCGHHIGGEFRTVREALEAALSHYPAEKP